MWQITKLSFKNTCRTSRILCENLPPLPAPQPTVLDHGDAKHTVCGIGMDRTQACARHSRKLDGRGFCGWQCRTGHLPDLAPVELLICTGT